MKAHDLSANQWEKRAGLGIGVVGKFLRDSNHDIGVATLAKLAAVLHLRARDLL